MSLRAKIVTAFIRRRISSGNPSLAAIRRGMTKLQKMLPPASRKCHIDPIDVAGLPALWIRPVGAEPQKALLFFHGGGYCFASPHNYRLVLTTLAKHTGAAILAVDYRLAPEHPFPAALEDAQTCWSWLRSRYEAKDLWVGGDSAGGGLTLSLLVNLRDGNGALPAAAFCWSPWTDLTNSGASVQRNAASDVISEAALQQMAGHYVVGQAADHPAISPLYAELHNLPPILIQVSDAEILLDDSLRIAERLEQAGTRVKLEVWKRLPHVWQVLVGWVPESRAAIKKTAAFLQSPSQVLTPTEDLPARAQKGDTSSTPLPGQVGHQLERDQADALRQSGN